MYMEAVTAIRAWDYFIIQLCARSDIVATPATLFWNLPRFPFGRALCGRSDWPVGLCFAFVNSIELLPISVRLYP